MNPVVALESKENLLTHFGYYLPKEVISMTRLLTGSTTFLLMFVVLVPAEGVFLEFNPSPPSAPEAPYGMLLGPSGVCPRINLDI